MSKELIPGRPNITEGYPPWMKDDETLIVPIPQPLPSSSDNLPDSIAKNPSVKCPGTITCRINEVAPKAVR